METLREIVIVLHLVSLAMLLGAWLVEVTNKTHRITRLMQWGMAAALVTGLALAASWGLINDLNYVKIGLKLGILVVIGALLGIGGAQQRRDQQVAPALFWGVGILTIANVAIAVLM